MRITFTKATISNPRQPRRGAIELEFLIDTGAIFSVLPGPIARKLALAKLDREECTLARRDSPRVRLRRGLFRAGRSSWHLEGRFRTGECNAIAWSVDPGESRIDGKSGYPRGLRDAIVLSLVSSAVDRLALRAMALRCVA
jgi:hypothetical protein